jgi:hypothetical protein
LIQWSVRVTWAMRLHKFAYSVHKYDPLLSKWELRWRLRKWRITWPVMRAERLWLTDSADIVQVVDARRPEGAASLLPAGWKPWVHLVDDISGMSRCALAPTKSYRPPPPPERLTCSPAWPGPARPGLAPPFPRSTFCCRHHATLCRYSPRSPRARSQQMPASFEPVVCTVEARCTS